MASGQKKLNMKLEGNDKIKIIKKDKLTSAHKHKPVDNMPVYIAGIQGNEIMQSHNIDPSQDPKFR